MNKWILTAMALALGGASADVWGQEQAPPSGELAQFQRVLNSWPYANPDRSLPGHEGGYHPDHPKFCRTCYGGGGCQRTSTCARCGPCAGDTCERGKVEGTCRKCGLLGRILFYECRRLGCGEVGGEGCKKQDPITICQCNGKSRTFHDANFARWLTGEGERVFWIGDKPHYTLRFNCYGEGKNHDGNRGYYGFCCGCYETVLRGNYDDRGPLNLDPLATSRCAAEDAIPSETRGANYPGATKSGCPNGDCGHGAEDRAIDGELMFGAPSAKKPGSLKEGEAPKLLKLESQSKPAVSAKFAPGFRK